MTYTIFKNFLNFLRHQARFARLVTFSKFLLLAVAAAFSRFLLRKNRENRRIRLRGDVFLFLFLVIFNF